jgi:Domain of unknown function (DUF5060)/Putative collagen-binding domain of a collagenase
MNTRNITALLLLLGATMLHAQPIFIEAESFKSQTLTEKRQWHIFSAQSSPQISPDGDPAHLAGASGGSYIEVLPDTRRSHADKLIQGENFINEGGKMAVLSYKVTLPAAGRYYVWVRAYSTTSEDNGLHFGLNGKWPESGARWQTVQKNGWNWDCKQRTAKVHTGVPMQLWLDVEKAGEHELLMSMREDGIEVDQLALTTDVKWRPEGYKERATAAPAAPAASSAVNGGTCSLNAPAFTTGAKGYYLDKGKWLAINPEKDKTATAQTAFPFPGGKYDVTLRIVGESDGQSTYQVAVNDVKVGEFKAPPSTETYEEGPKFATTFKSVALDSGDVITLTSQIASADGKEFSRARIAGLDFAPADEATKAAVAKLPPAMAAKPANPPKPAAPALVEPRKADGDGTVAISGELKQWHKVTLTLDGPFAHERDNQPNPFTDYALTVTFTHESGSPKYTVPGYFAADGDAANSSAESGTKWRAHLSPDKAGQWSYSISMLRGKLVAVDDDAQRKASPAIGASGAFTIAASDKTGRDFRAKGRLQYVGKHHLQFAGSKEYFLKAGADAPETLLAYVDFDGTKPGGSDAQRPGEAKPNKALKTWQPHAGDWKAGDPTWKGGKGKGLIGALNYLAGKGMNLVSFLPYNAGGDGDNVWPFVERNEKLHYDCSKLDQWGVVFDHGTALGLYLHFKLQENEMDDDRRGHESTPGRVPESLDGGKLGIERKLYCRELIARFGHALALNWNIGEENTQSTEEIRDMVKFLHDTDPYRHNIVIHTFPNQQDKVYAPLLGDKSLLTGASLQNNWNQVHQRTLQWVTESAKANRPWVVANDEQGPANLGVPPDPGYQGHDGVAIARKDGKAEGKGYTMHDIRKLTLWGNLMAGGAGVEYYFGYQLPENDLVAEDWRSRDKSWDYCRIALEFFPANKIPFWEMRTANALIGNTKNDNSKFCFAEAGELYLVYLPNGGTTDLDLTGANGKFTVKWFNPRAGGKFLDGSVVSITGGGKASLGRPPADAGEDWLIVVRK